MGMVVYSQFDVWWVRLDPTIGSEINKNRPCVIISPNEMNYSTLNTVIVAPMTTTKKEYPSRVNVRMNNKSGQVALDQIRTIDKKRLNNKIHTFDPKTCQKIIDVLQDMFSM